MDKNCQELYNYFLTLLPDRLKDECKDLLLDFFEGRDIEIDEKLMASALDGKSPFTQLVLRQVCAIPRGQVITYGELATRLGRPTAARAVGSALGRNELPVLIPCHRVVAANGMGGYAFGKEMKRRLLGVERRFSGDFLASRPGLVEIS